MKRGFVHHKNRSIFSLVAAIHIILVLLSLSGNLKSFFNDSALGKGQAADFFAVYQAGHNVTEGESVYLDTEGEASNYSYPFRYLSFIGYSLGVVLNIFKPFTAYYIWILFYEFLIGVNIYLTRKLCNKDEQFILASIPWLIFSPYLIEIFMGQWSFLLASLLFYTMYGIIKNTKSQYFYILAPLIKPNALIAAPVLLQAKKYKLLIVTILVTIVTSALYFQFFKSDISVFMQNFKDTMYSYGGNFGFKSLYYAIFVRQLSIPLPRLWFLAFTAGMGLFTLYMTFKRKDVVINFILWICYFFLIYRDIWEHHYVLMMPVFVLLIYRYKLTIRKLITKKYLPLLVSFVLTALPSIFVLQFLFVEDAPVEPDSLGFMYTVIYHLIKILGIIVLYTWIILLGRKN